ncbi:serine hydrolase domain-containing protein [Rapidithrix thailandica]|uniref:Serine hydrolase domain-containing protein n=1 Tax=Rapidithrix thailandica TaxID=413964 RepID=A0AAW9RV76_9BACT
MTEQVASKNNLPEIRPQLHLLRNKDSELDVFSKVDRKINRFLEKWELKGASIAMAKDGKLKYAKGFGYANEEEQILVQPFHQFRIASVSKLITAAAIMQLKEQGKIELTDKVFGENGILNDSLYLHPRNKRVLDIEVQHLLNHTSGFINQFRTDPMFIPLDIANTMDAACPPAFSTTLHFMLKQKRHIHPGSYFDYSNFGYCLLGAIIEKVSGESYESYVQTQLLQPIGVHQMHLAKNRVEDKRTDEVMHYDFEDAEPKLSIYGTGDSVSRVYEGNHIEALGPAGGWVTSPVELIRFVMAIDGDKTKENILNDASIRLMAGADSANQLTMGWMYSDKYKWMRTGNMAGAASLVCRLEDGSTWVFVSNTSTWKGPGFYRDIYNLMQNVQGSVKSWPEHDLFEKVYMW